MTEFNDRPDELLETDPVIARNVRILERSFIPNTPNLADPEEEEEEANKQMD